MAILVIILTFLAAFLIFYFITRSRFKHERIGRPTSINPPVYPVSIHDAASITTPILVFSSLEVKNTFTIEKGTIIDKNFYIIKGQVEVIHNNIRIGMLGMGQTTHNAFDFLGINYKLTKKALTDLTVSELPNTCEKRLAIRMLEKTCFEPSLRFFMLHSQIVKLETIKTSNFEDFLVRSFKISNHKVCSISVQNEVELTDCIYYVVSGELTIDGTVFGRGSVFGYFGTFFSYYKGFKCTSPKPTVLKYVPYAKLRDRADINSAMLHNLPLAMVCLGAVADWRSIPFETSIFEKGTMCKHLYLIDGAVYGCKECILGTEFETSLASEKTTDVVRISKLTIDILVKQIPQLYENIIIRMFAQPPSISKIVLIAPAAQKCDVFIKRLKKTLSTDATFLDNIQISEILGKNVFSPIGNLIISERLNSLKENYKVVVVHLENEYSRMLKIVYPYCDIVFLVGSSLTNSGFARKNVEYVRLYERRYAQAHKKPSKIKSALLYSMFSEWLSEDPSSESEIPQTDKIHTNPLETCQHKGLDEFSKYRRVHHILSPKEMNFCNKDYERFARYLLGERFGLVLGGGGARGYAHIGVIKALEEENIPIDIVGGTSMGAFVGALYSRELDYMEVYTLAKKMSRRGSSFIYFLMDLTFPFVSLFSGRMLDHSLKMIFDEQQIQNFWLEYYCVTTNLKTSAEAIHFNGSAFKYIRSSMAFAGVVPPVFYKGEILCDGAYTNNLPTDVMVSLGVKNIISVRVSEEFNNVICEYDSSSGLILFFKSLFLSKNYLTLLDTQHRLSFLIQEKKLDLIPTQNLVIMPELGDYKVSDFHKFDEIVACGYETAKMKIKEWKSSGRIKMFKKIVRRFSI